MFRVLWDKPTGGEYFIREEEVAGTNELPLLSLGVSVRVQCDAQRDGAFQLALFGSGTRGTT